MLKWLFARKKPIRCWVIKQIDPGLLHLCTKGTLQTDLKPDQALQQLRSGQYQGPVQMGESGLILHSQLFAKLIPEQDLQLDDHYQASWQGKSWRVAKVLQPSWTWSGRMEAVRNPAGQSPPWISVEDVSELRQKASSQPPPGSVTVFGAANALEPLDKDVQEAVNQAQRQRQERHRPQLDAWDWHRDS